MKPALYKSGRDARNYARDLNNAWPKSLGMTFDAFRDFEGYRVVATDMQGKKYFVTPRQKRLCAINFVLCP